jgi:AcrR family transcriptional regulator
MIFIARACSCALGTRSEASKAERHNNATEAIGFSGEAPIGSRRQLLYWQVQMSSPRLQPRRTEILRAARICFLDRGFVRTTISDVIAHCGGSRATIYEEFGSKEGLFAALVDELIDQMRLPDVEPGPPEAVLVELGLAYMDRLMDPEALALYRVALGESAHVRQLGPALFASGPQRAAATVAGWLASWRSEGVLRIDDPVRAATLFLAMVEGDLHRSAVMWASTPSAEAIASNVEAAAALFLHGAVGSSEDRALSSAAE